MLAIPFPQIDPALFTIAIGDFQFSLRWYALAYIAGLLIGWRLVVLLMRRPGLWPGGVAPMKPSEPEELLTWMVIGVIAGGRLGFVLFYNPSAYLADPLSILMVWEGGMSFHGGFLGVILGVVLFTRARAMPLLQVGDAVALATPTGLFFGRIANFINGELWGRQTEVSWGMVFPSVPPEYWNGPENLPRHPSQLYEAVTEGLLLGLAMWWLATRRGWLKHPGAMVGVFFIGYGAARTFVEFFRQGNLEYVTPDNPWGQSLRFGSGPDAFGLTMGQLLSLPMVAIGLVFLAIAFRRRAMA